MASSMAIRAGRAFVELFVKSKDLVGGLRAAEDRIKKFGMRVQNIGRSMMKLGAIIAAPMALSTKVFIGFDDQMRAVQATLGATGKDFDTLTEKAEFLGRTTSFTAAQVAGSMLEQARAGFNVKEIDAATSGMLSLARATGTDLAMATNIAGNTLRAFGLEASDMNHVADVLVATANNSAQTLEDLGEAMKYAAPVADAYGLSLEQTSKAMGALANFGIKGSMAGNTMKNIMLQLADSSVRKKIEDLGVAVTDSAGGFRDVGTILTNLGTAVQNMPTPDKLALMNELFGKRAVTGGIKLTTANFEALNRAIDKADGTAKRTSDTMDSGLGGVFRRLMSAVEGVAIAVGGSLSKELSLTGDRITEVATKIAEWVKANGATIVSVAKTTVKIIAFGAALLAVGKAAFAIINITKALTGLATIIKTLGLAVAAGGPLAWVALAGLAVAAFTMYVIDAKRETAQLSENFRDMAEANRQAMDAMTSEQTGIKQKAERLQELQGKLKMTNVEMLEAKTITTDLAKLYPKLAGHLRLLGKEAKTTAEFYERLDKAQAEQIKTSLENQLKETQKEAELIGYNVRDAEEAKEIFARHGGDKYSVKKELLNKNSSLGSFGMGAFDLGVIGKVDDEVDRMEALIRNYDGYVLQLAKAKDEIERINTILYGGPAASTTAPAGGERMWKSDEKALEKIKSETEKWQQESHKQKLQAIEDEHQRALALMHEKYNKELENARKLGTAQETEGLVGQITQARDAERDRILADYTRQKDAEREQYDASKLDIDNQRRADIDELNLRMKYKGVELEKQLLKLEEQRATAAARRTGASLILIMKEFALRRQLLDVPTQIADNTRVVSGTHNSNAAWTLAAMNAKNPTEERIASATEKTEKNTRDLASLAKSGGMAFS